MNFLNEHNYPQYHTTTIYPFENNTHSDIILLNSLCDLFLISLGIFGALFPMYLLYRVFKTDFNENNCNYETDSGHEYEHESENMYELDSIIPDRLDYRMKYYEKKSMELQKIDPQYPFIVRIDGRAFSKFTKQLEKNDLPYSINFKNAMLKTSTDLLHEFNVATVYTHSDEITLVFPAQKLLKDCKYSEHLFGGRVSKILSVVPSYASACFYKHISSSIKESNNIPHFDARLIVFPIKNTYEIVNHMIWRSKVDCTRNFVSMYAQKYIGNKNIENMNTFERIKILKNEYGIDLDNDVDYGMKHGVFMKKNFDKTNNINNTMYYIFRNIKFSNDMLTFTITNDVPTNILDIFTHNIFVEPSDSETQQCIQNIAYDNGSIKSVVVEQPVTTSFSDEYIYNGVISGNIVCTDFDCKDMTADEIAKFIVNNAVNNAINNVVNINEHQYV